MCVISDPAEVLCPVQARYLSLHRHAAFWFIPRLWPVSEHQGTFWQNICLQCKILSPVHRLCMTSHLPPATSLYV